MRYRFLEDVAIADVAFEAEGNTLPELFSTAALAVTNTMVKDLHTVGQSVMKNSEIEAADLEMLLYRFLQTIVFYKDAELLLFSRFDADISEDHGKWCLNVRMHGEEINQEKHQLLADVKAVSLHSFRVRKTAEGWHADVILDV